MCGCHHRSDHDLAALYFSMLPDVSNSETKFAEQTLRHWQQLSASRCQRNPMHRSYKNTTTSMSPARRTVRVRMG